MNTQAQNPETQTEARSEDLSAAYKEAAIELGKGIALGLVPFLGQAIDAYDTIESAIVLYNAKEQEGKESAQFDMVLALIGWIPGPGDGVKKSLRLVNKDPQRFAPVLFDLLRFVLQECGIKTSPEALLDEIFDAGKLRGQLNTIVQGIEKSSTFQAMPQDMQTAVKSSLGVVQTSLPMMVGVVQKRLTRWKRKQPNSSAHVSTTGRAPAKQPGSQHAGAEGQSRPAHGSAGDAVRTQVATQALSEITDEMVGISGEHIADYMCAYGSAFGWGKDWSGHDLGAQGAWTAGNPGKTKTGKLSAGGNSKERHILYKLSDGPNGTGIDSVWRADRNNRDRHGKDRPYAIVEAKASRNEDAPKFMRQISLRKPAITSMIGDNAPNFIVTDPSELIEPLEEVATPKSKGGGGKAGGKAGGKVAAPTQQSKGADAGKSATTGTKPILVQMSSEWILANIKKAVEKGIADEIRVKGERVYARHLFYAPQYHRSGSPAMHLKAKHENLPDKEHTIHDAYHYGDRQVVDAVNKRKASLREKYGNLPTLKAEK